MVLIATAGCGASTEVGEIDFCCSEEETVEAGIDAIEDVLDNNEAKEQPEELTNKGVKQMAMFLQYYINANGHKVYTTKGFFFLILAAGLTLEHDYQIDDCFSFVFDFREGMKDAIELGQCHNDTSAVGKEAIYVEDIFKCIWLYRSDLSKSWFDGMVASTTFNSGEILSSKCDICYERPVMKQHLLRQQDGITNMSLYE
ncbi:uncharacterized protein G2W53_018943 [Senna tora]|uniref:Uncharacterized protein n=1 Tax=Senna tora TaxID=362788 RepID=A0A834WRS7_9FABA|nr:uncharacterized protein G2W53_018943 [Senna tora]